MLREKIVRERRADVGNQAEQQERASCAERQTGLFEYVAFTHILIHKKRPSDALNAPAFFRTQAANCCPS